MGNLQGSIWCARWNNVTPGRIEQPRSSQVGFDFGGLLFLLCWRCSEGANEDETENANQRFQRNAPV